MHVLSVWNVLLPDPLLYFLTINNTVVIISLPFTSKNTQA